MEVILIFAAFFVVWIALIFTAKNSIAYKEFVVNGIKPEIKKLIQNQPQTRKYVQNLNSLQQWKKCLTHTSNIFIIPKLYEPQ